MHSARTMMTTTSRAASSASASILRSSPLAAAAAGGGGRPRPPSAQSDRAPSLHGGQRRHFARQRGGRRSPGGFDTFSYDERTEPKANKNILVLGSSGVLGKTVVSHFGHHFGWNVVGADVLAPNKAAKKGLGAFVALPREGSLSDLTGELYQGVSTKLRGGETDADHLDAIVVASGGWAGDVDLTDVMENHLEQYNKSELEDVDVEEEYARESAAVCERMMRMNYYPVVAGSQVGRRFMKRGGLFVIIGASAALSPTPGMLGYGSAKSAAHHYLTSMGPASQEENDITSVGILPLMIDTPDNREVLGVDDDSDGYSKMVKPIHIANEIGEWIEKPHLRPHAGSLVKVISKSRRDGSGGAAFHLVR